MKLCEYCKKPIELALLEHNNETTVCGRCRKLDVNEFYDVIKKEIQTCALESEDKKRLEKRLLDRTREISNHYRESLITHEENIEEVFKTKHANEKLTLEQEKSSLINTRNRLLAEQEELVGKNCKLVREHSCLEQKIQFLIKELNKYVINNHISNIQNDQIILYVNPERKTERSPLVIGRVMVKSNSYDVVIWANLDKSGRRYWAGYLNDVNGYIDGKENNRRIHFRKSEDKSSLIGQISFGDVARPITLFVQEYNATNLIYWTGQILEQESAADFLKEL